MQIKGFEDVLELCDAQIVMEVNAHSICRFKTVIKEQDVNKYVRMAATREKTEITAGYEKIVLFSGFVNEVIVEQSAYSTVISVTVLSDTYLLSEKCAKRVFQDTSLTYKKVLENFKEDVELDFQNAEKTNENIDGILIQDNVSDYDFLKATAALADCGLWEIGKKLLVGSKNTNSRKIKYNYEDRTNSALNIKSIFSQNCSTVKFESLIFYQNGTVVTFENGNFDEDLSLNHIPTDEFIITKIEVYHSNMETKFKYTAMQKPDFSNDLFEGFMLTKAKVIKNTDNESLGRIQTEFLDYEDKSENKDKNYMMQCMTPYTGQFGGGIVFIPDENDTVIVGVQNRIPYVMGRIREQKLKDKCSETANKTIMIGENRYLQFDKNDNIFIENTDNVSVKLTGEEIFIKNTDDVSLKITGDEILIKDTDDTLIKLTKNDITASRKKSAITLKDDKLILNEDSDCKIEMQKNQLDLSCKSTFTMADKKAVIKSGSASVSLSSNAAEIKGSKIDLKS